MASCLQATNYYQNQCWPRSHTPYAALAITPSHQQNTHDFTDGRKNMNYIFDNYVCSACAQDATFKMSSVSPDMASLGHNGFSMLKYAVL